MTIKNILNFINYKLTAFTEHDIHSPFVFNFYNELILNKYPFFDFEDLSIIRANLLKNETTLTISDFGAGSKKIKKNTRTISKITKHGISQKKQSEFLYRLLNKFNPKTVIELGTSVGLTTMYLAKAIPQSTIYTIEGCPNLAAFSKQLFKTTNIPNITSINGNFNTELPKLLNQLNTIDVLYIDGNHAYEPTLLYFNLALQKKHANSIFIFDDINWSNDMQKAWQQIKLNNEVTLSLDFYHFGIVFFRTEQLQKQHFVLNF